MSIPKCIKAFILLSYQLYASCAHQPKTNINSRNKASRHQGIKASKQRTAHKAQMSTHEVAETASDADTLQVVQPSTGVSAICKAFTKLQDPGLSEPEVGTLLSTIACGLEEQHWEPQFEPQYAQQLVAKIAHCNYIVAASSFKYAFFFKLLMQSLNDGQKAQTASHLLGMFRCHDLSYLGLEMLAYFVAHSGACAQAIAEEEGIAAFSSSKNHISTVDIRLMIISELLSTPNSNAIRAFLNLDGVDLLDRSFHSTEPMSTYSLRTALYGSKCIRTIALSDIQVDDKLRACLLRTAGELLSQTVEICSSSSTEQGSYLNQTVAQLVAAIDKLLEKDEGVSGVTYGFCSWKILETSSAWQPAVLCQVCNSIRKAKGIHARITYALMMNHADSQVFIEAWKLHARMLQANPDFVKVNNELNSRVLATKLISKLRNTEHHSCANLADLCHFTFRTDTKEFVAGGGIQALIYCLKQVMCNKTSDDDLLQRTKVCQYVVAALAIYSSEASFWDYFEACDACEVLTSFTATSLCPESQPAANKLLEQFASRKKHLEAAQAVEEAACKARQVQAAEYTFKVKLKNCFDEVLAHAKEAQEACLPEDNALHYLHQLRCETFALHALEFLKFQIRDVFKPY